MPGIEGESAKVYIPEIFNYKLDPPLPGVYPLKGKYANIPPKEYSFEHLKWMLGL